MRSDEDAVIGFLSWLMYDTDYIIAELDGQGEWHGIHKTVADLAKDYLKSK